MLFKSGYSRPQLKAISAGVLVMLAQQALAQEDSGKIQQVTVVANRKQEAIRDVPMAIDVISAKEIQALNLLDVKDLQSLSPGLQMTNTDGRNNVASLRGVSFNPDTGVSVAAVGLYVNNVAVSPQVGFNAMYDVGQVEVLRGPQGTLQGLMTPAGAITLTTQRAELSRIGGYLQATGTNHGGSNLQGAVNLPLISDQLALRFAAVSDRNRGSEVTNLVTGTRAHNSTDSYRLSLAWRPLEDLRIDLMHQSMKVDSVQTKQLIGSGVVTPFNLGRPETPLSVRDLNGSSDLDNTFGTDAPLTTLKANWNIGERHSLTLTMAHQSSTLTQLLDIDNGNIIPGSGIPQKVRSTGNDNYIELLSNSYGDPFWNFTFGASRQWGDSGATVNVSNGAFTLDIPGATRSDALFTRQTFTLSDSLTLAAGLRYSRLSVDRQSTIAVPGYTFPPSIPADQAHTVDKPVTFGLSLTKRFTPQLNGYLSYGNSFRPGTFSGAAVHPIPLALLSSGSEKSNAIEAGIKSDLFDRRATLNVAVFAQKYKGFIGQDAYSPYVYTDPVSGQRVQDGFGFNYQGDARIVGIEQQFTARLSTDWDFNASGSYVLSKWTSGETPCNDSNGDGVPDAGVGVIPAGQTVAMCRLSGPIAELPKFSLSAGSEYRFRYGAVRPYVSGLFTYRPGFHSQKVSYDYGTQASLNLYAGVRDGKGKWEASVFVKNALDQRHVSNTGASNLFQSVGALGVFDSGYRNVNTPAPRSLGLTARYNFN